jgi:hypothetical protein
MPEIPLEYRKWVADYVARTADVAGRCREASLEMNSRFPELVPERGMVLAADGRRYMHWWLMGPFGEIVDPTEIQFGRIVEYPV